MQNIDDFTICSSECRVHTERQMTYNDTKYSDLLGRVDVNNTRKERFIVGPHPVTSKASWYMKHAPICPQSTSHFVVSLCLFGIPGVVDGKAGKFLQNKDEFIKNVANHIHWTHEHECIFSCVATSETPK